MCQKTSTVKKGVSEMRCFNKSIWFISILLLVLLVFLIASAYPAATGKISGRVVDKSTSEPLPGVNVLLRGTTLGTVTDIDGYFVILNVPPGSYSLQASMVGYAVMVQEH